jgi:hypothetical protein
MKPLIIVALIAIVWTSTARADPAADNYELMFHGDGFTLEAKAVCPPEYDILAPLAREGDAIIRAMQDIAFRWIDEGRESFRRQILQDGIHAACKAAVWLGEHPTHPER